MTNRYLEKIAESVQRELTEHETNVLKSDKMGGKHPTALISLFNPIAGYRSYRHNTDYENITNNPELIEAIRKYREANPKK